MAKINADSYNVYMRVLIIFNHPAPYKVNSFNELAKYVDLTVLFERTSAADRPESFYRKNQYHFNHTFLKNGYFGREGNLSSKVKKYIKNHHNEYDVIIMNGYSHLSEIKAIRYMHRHHIKFTLLINGGVVKKEGCLKKAYKTSLVNKAAYYISPSKASDEYLMYYGAKKENIYNYPYSNLYKKEIGESSLEDINTIREKYHLPKGIKLFINASQFIKRKNNIQLMSLFKDRKEHLVLVGSGPLKQQYEDYIKSNKLDNVHILPFMEKKELFNLFRACDAHISLSKQDIFGHTVLEAFACGLPVICSNKVVSALEYIKDGYNGYLVDLNNSESILEAINNIDSINKENVIKSVENNTFESSAKAIYEILEKIYG